MDNKSNSPKLTFRPLTVVSRNVSECGKYFSVSYDLIPRDTEITYDLYVNASDFNENFIRFWKAGDFLPLSDLEDRFNRYRQIYVAEKDRTLYLNALCSLHGKKDEDKVNALKDSAIHHIKKIFNQDNKLSADILSQSMIGSHDVIANMVDVLNDYDVDELKDLIAKLSFHDFYTFDHSVNVAMYCILLFRAIVPDADRGEIITAGMAGLFHDLGKIKIPTEILNGTGTLTKENYDLIKQHPNHGKELLARTKFPFESGINSSIISRVACEHHEDFDGNGYPNKVKGEHIHFIARICAVADFFDAVTTKRSYQSPLPVNEALSLMNKYVGKKLDPEMFKAFVTQTANFEKVRVSRLGVTDKFDPCMPFQEGAFEVNTSLNDPNSKEELNFGDIVLICKNEEDFQAWIKNPNNKIKIKKKV